MTSNASFENRLPTVTEAVKQLVAGTCTSESLVEQVLAEIRTRDDALNAYRTVDESSALEQARAADIARQEGRQGRMLGVPVAIKDVLNVQGQTCTCGSKILESYVAPYDATAVAKLREEGAVFVGRTNMDEFAMGSSSENSAYGVVRNPHQHDCVPGGSSGGAAAAVAAGEAICGLGTDTGGSVRQPAAFCGCVGLKPSYGRVSRYGLTAFASSLDQVGTLTRSVRDAALLLGIMSGVDSMDSTSLDEPVPDYTAGLKEDLSGFKIGVPQEYFTSGIDPEVENAVRMAIENCAKIGAEIREISLPHTEYSVAVYCVIATAEASANLARFDGVRYGIRDEDADDPVEMYRRTRAQGFGAEVKRRIILGTYVLSSGYHDAYYLSAQKVRTLIRRDFETAFDECDALLTPCTPTPAYRFGEKVDDPLQMYLGDLFTVTANLAGICGITLPCGYTGGGLPIGLQVLGPAFKEENILRVAHAYEQTAAVGKS